jgi:hypothetical protein
MNEEHTRYLVENYPRLYARAGDAPEKSSMAFGFQCEDGWFELIRELSEKLEPLGVVAECVKEKYGGLRFYVDSGSFEVWDLIEEAENQSTSICELCGAPGGLTQAGWYSQTLCSKCENNGV